MECPFVRRHFFAAKDLGVPPECVLHVVGVASGTVAVIAENGCMCAMLSEFDGNVTDINEEVKSVTINGYTVKINERLNRMVALHRGKNNRGRARQRARHHDLINGPVDAPQGVISGARSIFIRIF